MAELVRLRASMDIAKARIAMSVLEAGGIPVFLFDEHFDANIFPPASLFRVRLMVPEEFAAEAAELLEVQEQD